MKRILSIIMAFCLICATNNFVFAKENTEVSISGVSMTPVQFKNAFGVKPDRQTLSYSLTRKAGNLDIRIMNVVIKDEDISFIMELTKNETVVKLPLSGKLRASYKTENGINSIVIDVDSIINGYEILLFEIFNDDCYNNLLVNKELEEKPHIKVYLKDSENIYLFESALPNTFLNLKANDYEKAEKYNDALWASSLVEHEVQEVPTNDAIMESLGINTQKNRGLDSWSTWVNPTTYTDAFYVGSEYAQCTSLPYVEYIHSNVTSQTSTWAASFKVAEHTKIGNYTYHGNNPFEYRNVNLSFASGDKTTILRTFQEGRVYDHFYSTIKVAGNDVTVSLLKKVLSHVPAGTTIATAISAINSMTSSTGKVILGSTGVNLSGQQVSAVGEELASDYTIEECTDYGGSSEVGHYFTYQADLKYVTGSGNSNTVGALVVKFDKYYAGDSSYTPISKQFTLNYTASAS